MTYRPLRQAWAFVLRCPNRIARKERRSSPRFLGDPCAHALLFDPGGAPTPGQYGVSAIAFRLVNSVGSTSSLSGLNHTACTPPVYASQPGSPLDRATLGSGGRPLLTGQDFHLWATTEGFRSSLSCGSLPPPPGFAWRNNRLIDRPAPSPKARFSPVVPTLVLDAQVHGREDSAACSCAPRSA